MRGWPCVFRQPALISRHHIHKRNKRPVSAAFLRLIISFRLPVMAGLYAEIQYLRGIPRADL
nr:MAG TPA: hypothetical protein [Caudoviricetes sp.]